MSSQRQALTRNPHPVGEGPRERLLATLPVTPRRTSIAGVPTTLLEGGHGPPVVFVQAEHALVWLRVIPDLVKTRRVIVPDLPGLGESDLPAGRYDIEATRGWLAALIDEACETQPVLAGKGPAGALAAHFAATDSDRLAGLVLIDAHGLARFRPPAGMALSYLMVMMRPTQERVERSLGAYCFTDLQRVRADLGEQWEWFSAYTVDYFRTPRVKKAMRTLMPRLGKPIASEDLARISVPTTLIWGREDLAMPLAAAEAASARYGWPLHVIDDARDDPALEQPDAFLNALRTALDSLDPHS